MHRDDRRSTDQCFSRGPRWRDLRRVEMTDYPDWPTIAGSHRVRGRNFPRLAEDMPSFLGVPIAISPKDLKQADIVIIGAPFAAGWGAQYSGVDKELWLAGPKRVRQQSIRYGGYVQDFDLDILEELKIVDYGDAAIPPEANYAATVENILRAQAAVEAKVNDVLDAGAIPIVIGQNSPCGSYAIAKPIAERATGNVGVISLDTHWDSRPIDWATMDPRIAGSGNWKAKLYEFHKNVTVPNLVEIGERGMLEDKSYVRRFVREGAHFVPMWRIRAEFGLEGALELLAKAYHGTSDVYVHFDMDVLGGAGPAPGDLLGDLAEPIGMTDYEVIRIAHEVGLRGLSGLSFICIPPGSAVTYRTIVYVITYLLAGLALSRRRKLTGA
ncbi:MAG TPA: arginase family protein [Stellaceae bacterium]|nr:arginase family protein [Stellaceae bacterium]